MLVLSSALEGILIELAEFIVQDAMDLIAGHYTVSRSNPSPFEMDSLRVNLPHKFAVVNLTVTLDHLYG